MENGECGGQRGVAFRYGIGVTGLLGGRALLLGECVQRNNRLTLD